MVNVYSVTKAWTAICAHVLADRGQLDLDSPVHRYWPGFADFGKDAVTVAQILSHQAASRIREGFPRGPLYNWTQMVEALRDRPRGGRRQPPRLPQYDLRVPGRRGGAPRIEAKCCRFFREEVAEPLGVDCHIGFGPEHDQRVAELTTPCAAGISSSTPRTCLRPPGSGERGFMTASDAWSRAANIVAHRCFCSRVAGQGVVSSARADRVQVRSRYDSRLRGVQQPPPGRTYQHFASIRGAPPRRPGTRRSYCGNRAAARRPPRACRASASTI